MNRMHASMQAVCVQRIREGMPLAEDFAVCDRPVPEPGDRQVLVRVRWLSLDPFLRAQLGGRHLASSPTPGDIVPGYGIGQVLEDRTGRFDTGTLVVAPTGWSEYAVVDADQANPVHTGAAPVTTALGVLGIPGLTAWSGVHRMLEPKPGQTILVSSAAGTVGAVAGQLCKAAGCRVVGISSRAEKCAMAVDEYGFDACVSRLDEHFIERLRDACPDGIDGYFDNVGGAVLEAALSILRPRARVVLCGLIDQYSRAERPPGPNLGPVIAARARLQGLVVYDHLPAFARCREELGTMLEAGTLRCREHVVEGLEHAATGFIGLLEGRYLGKVVVKLEQSA